MIAVRVSPPFRFSVVGSPDYLARHGRPQTPEDLIRFPCIRFRQTTSQSIYRWEFMAGNHPLNVAIDGPIIVNDSSVNIAAAKTGSGSPTSPSRWCGTKSTTARSKPCWTKYLPVTPGIFMYFPSRSQAMPKLRAFIDHMRAALTEFEREMMPRSPD